MGSVFLLGIALGMALGFAFSSFLKQGKVKDNSDDKPNEDTCDASQQDSPTKETLLRHLVVEQSNLLESLTKNELIVICKQRGLPVGGLKAELMKRLIADVMHSGPSRADIVSALLKRE